MPLTAIFLGLGSNKERQQHLTAALDALNAFLPKLRCSPVFESEAVGIKGDNFYNLVVAAQTDLPLLELSQRLKTIEADNGRYAPDRQGLPLDIDVLLYGQQVGTLHGMVLPRAEILKNAFVLAPLSLLAPDAIHPGEGKTFAALWQSMPKTQKLWPVPFVWNGKALTPNRLLCGHTTF